MKEIKNCWIRLLIEKNELEKAGMEAVVYKEEQFVYDCDSVEFNVYVMLWKDGLVNSSVRIEKIE